MLVNKKYTIYFQSRNIQFNSGVGLPAPCLPQLVDGLIFVRIIGPTLLALQVRKGSQIPEGCMVVGMLCLFPWLEWPLV